MLEYCEIIVQMYPHKGAFPPMGAPSNLAQNNLPIIGENQWMSQNAYQNIDLDKVDWAVLAQQWIHMKESNTIGMQEPIPNAPPPPRFSSTNIDYEEQGEAPMEVEHEDEQTPHINATIVNVAVPPPPPTNVFQSTTNNWNTESNNRGHHQKHWNKSKFTKQRNDHLYKL